MGQSIGVLVYLQQAATLRGASACLVIGLAITPTCAQTVPISPSTALQQARDLFVRHLNDDRNDIANAQSLLARARAAHEQATSDNDSDGINVTAQAISAAQQALDRDQHNLAEDQLRLSVIDHVLGRISQNSASTNVPANGQSATVKQQLDMDLLMDTILSSGTKSAWPGPEDPEKPLVNPLTAPHEATLNAASRLLLALADEGITDPRAASVRQAMLAEISNAVGARYEADLDFRRQMDTELSAAIGSVEKERERDVAAADDRRFTRLRNAFEEFEKQGLLRNDKPVEGQEKQNAALHVALEAARTDARTKEEPELKAIADATAIELKGKILKLAADNRLAAELWEKQNRRTW